MWNLTFISEEDLTSHVKATIANYGEKLESYDLNRYVETGIDPIKLLFDKNVYHANWNTIISNEISRQREKANSCISYFHKGIFRYMPNCHIPTDGKEGSWDVIYKNPAGIPIPDAGIVHTIYAQLKNASCTLDSKPGRNLFIRMQNQLLSDNDCACFLIDIIAPHSQNIKWEHSLDNLKVGHKLIRRVSLDQFYALVTGQEDAFYQVCMALPAVIEKAVQELDGSLIPHDTVMDELRERASQLNIASEDMSIAMATYLLGFGGYTGFSQK